MEVSVCHDGAVEVSVSVFSFLPLDAAAVADPARGSSVLSSTCHASRWPWKDPKRIMRGAVWQASGGRVRSHRIALTLYECVLCNSRRHCSRVSALAELPGIQPYEQLAKNAGSSALSGIFIHLARLHEQLNASRREHKRWPG